MSKYLNIINVLETKNTAVFLSDMRGLMRLHFTILKLHLRERT